MKKRIVNVLCPAIAAISVVVSIIISTTSCKKEPCYFCEKNAATHIDYSSTTVCGYEQRDYYVQHMGYTCTENGNKKHIKKK